MSAPTTPPASAALAAGPNERLPPYFPRVARACAAPAEAFFACFARGATPGDAAAGTLALAACRAELASYKACSELHLRRRELAVAPSSYTDQLATGGGAPR